MSIIMPAGNNKTEWSPKEAKEEKVVKTASAETKEVVTEEVDALLVAAKSVVAKQKKQAQFDMEAPCGDVGEEVAEEKAIDKVQEATEAVEVAVEELKGAVEDAGGVHKEEGISVECPEGEGDVEEVEIEIVDDEKSPEVSVEIPDGEKKEEKIMVKSEEPKEEKKECACAGKEEKLEKDAGTEEEFCKFAKLSPQNKKKLSNYWVNMLGYPKDYVALMTKDFEK